MHNYSNWLQLPPEAHTNNLIFLLLLLSSTNPTAFKVFFAILHRWHLLQSTVTIPQSAFEITNAPMPTPDVTGPCGFRCSIFGFAAERPWEKDDNVEGLKHLRIADSIECSGFGLSHED